MPLHLLRYQSTAQLSLTDKDLQALLTKARAFNKLNQISGMLLYRAGQFVQVLEGEEDVLRSLYNKIACDPRHTNVLKLADEPLHQRGFAGWSMAYRQDA